MTKNPNPLAETMHDASCPHIEMPPYELVIEDDHDRFYNDKCKGTIIASIDEATDFMQLLGNTCRLKLSCEYRSAHPGLYERLSAAGAACQDRAAPLDIDRAAELMKKVPLDLKSLTGSHIALRQEDPKPALIKKELVHKTSESNILISEPFSVGNLHYFNMFFDTTELVFDHPSDHVQGMLILEALRQAGIATAHLHGFPLNGKLALLLYNTNFHSFIEKASPVLLRSFSNFSYDESVEYKDYFVTIQAVQWGKVCTDTIIRSVAYMNDRISEKINKQLERIALRNKKNFETNIRRILESESAEICVLQ